MRYNTLDLHQQLHEFPVPPEAENFDFVGRAEEARDRIAPDVLESLTLEPSETLSFEPQNNQVLVLPAYKLPGGTFKFLSAMTSYAEAREAGHDKMIAPTARTYGIGLGHAVRRFGGQATCLIPENAMPAVQAAVRESGATVEVAGQWFDETLRLAQERAKETGEKLLHPFASLGNVAGTGILGLHLVEADSEMTHLTLPVGGGSAASGIGGVVKQLRPETHITIAQAAGCSPVVDSLLSGKLQEAQYEHGQGLYYLRDLGGVGVRLTDPLTLGLASRVVDATTAATTDRLKATMYEYQQNHPEDVLPGIEAALSLEAARRLARHPEVRDATIVAVLTALNTTEYDPGHLGSRYRMRVEEESDAAAEPQIRESTAIFG